MASDRHVRMVTLHGDLFILHCNHLNTKSSAITFRRMSFHRDSGTFLNKDEEMIPVYESSSRAASVVGCGTAVDARVRQRVPCILLRLRRKGSQGFRYTLYSVSGGTRAERQVEFSLPYKMDESVWILRGPTVVWSHQNVVFYTSAGAGSVKEVPMRLRVSFLGEMPLPKRQLAILGLLEEDEAGCDGGAKPVLYFVEDGSTFSGDALLPRAYASVVGCMLVLSAKQVDGSLRSSVVAATRRKQLVHFQNGLPDEVCPLPYQDPRGIRAVHAASGCLIVILFEHGNVCAVWKDTFRVVACWTDVRLLLVDDFVGAGSEQVLLLFEEPDSAEGMPGKFLLTDLCGVSYSCGTAESAGVNGSKAVEDNRTLTIQALEARLQSGLVFLQDLQRDLRVKDQVIQQCVSALRDLLSDRKCVPSPALQEGLLPLLDEQSEEDECTPRVRTQADQTESFPNPDRVWHRVIGRKLVCGALLAPTHHMMDSEHMIAAVIATPPLVCSASRLVCYPDSMSSMRPEPPNAKRSKCPTGPVVLVVTDLAPLLTFDPLNCSVLLHFSTEEAGRVSRHGKLVSIELKGAFEGRFQPRLLTDCSADSDESREDLLSLMVALESWGFRIVSADRTVMDVALFLEEKLGAKPVAIHPQYLLCGSTQPSGAMLFRWNPCSSFDGILEVYSSDHLGLLGFLNTLCNFLPASHRVKLMKTGQDRNISPALFMEHEIRFIKEGVAELIQGGAEEQSSDPLAHISREQWLKDKSDRLRPLVQGKLYHGMVERAINLKMASDVATLVEAELNEYR